MDNDRKVELNLVQNNQLNRGNIPFPTPQEKPDPFQSGLLALFGKKNATPTETTSENASQLLSLLCKVNPNGAIVQLLQNVHVDLLNSQGDAKVHYHYDIANYGFRNIDSRIHKLWFSKPQSDLNIFVHTKFNRPLDFEILEITSHFVEIKVILPQVLEPSDRTTYDIKFSLKGEFNETTYFEMTTRTVTSRMSLTVISPEDFRFSKKCLVLESSDGFTDENPTLISMSIEGNREKLYWQFRKPKAGDHFKTTWSIARD